MMHLQPLRIVASITVAIGLSLLGLQVASAAVSESEVFARMLDTCDPLTPGVVTRSGERVGLFRENGRLHFIRIDRRGNVFRTPEKDRSTVGRAFERLEIGKTSRVLERQNGDFVFLTARSVFQMSPEGQLRWSREIESTSEPGPVALLDNGNVVVFRADTRARGAIEQVIYDVTGAEVLRKLIDWPGQTGECRSPAIDVERLSAGRFIVGSLCRNGLRLGIVSQGKLEKQTFIPYASRFYASADCSWICDSPSDEDALSLFVRRTNRGVYFLTEHQLLQFNDELKLEGEVDVGAFRQRSGADAKFLDLAVTPATHVIALAREPTLTPNLLHLRGVQFATQGEMRNSEWQVPVDKNKVLYYRSIVTDGGEAKLVFPGTKATAEFGVELTSSSEEKPATTLPSPEPISNSRCACSEPEKTSSTTGKAWGSAPSEPSSPSALSEARKKVGVSFGGQISKVRYDGHSRTFGGADFALSYEIFWGSVGLATDNAQERYLTTVEGGGYLIVNAGLGVSILTSNEPTRVRPHLFFGLPLPLPLADYLKTVFFLEPYYRPTFPGFGNTVVTHEYGLLIKLYVGPGTDNGGGFRF
jgi:hypothetical protein